MDNQTYGNLLGQPYTKERGLPKHFEDHCTVTVFDKYRFGSNFSTG